MRQNAGATPDQLFKPLILIHAMFLIAPLIYIVCGEVIPETIDPDFEGLAQPDFDLLWLVRLILVGFSLLEIVLAMTLFRGQRYVERILESGRLKGNGPPDAAMVGGALQSAHITRIGMLEAIGVYGLVLFLLGGERLDLYGFCAASITALLLTWPRRGEWEDTFKTLSQRYPGVPSNPWQSQASTA